ncbi:claudin-34 [Cololabis saira]|uniref:claudin-34 n=1 Tax=Cololabis saira TaxID=129043 RepID=UPI002AD3ED9A|nr:claudin-34 [Cololabis saira]XP_061593054.1 claudin-34 [Cololabis saira]
MLYLANTAHWQFLGLIVGALAWILTTAAVGIDEWRVWYIDDVTIITSGEAWVGIWKACFLSHAFPMTENCWSIGFSDPFAPVEIRLAQVLMMLAVICGLAGNISGALAMRMVYFSVEHRSNMRMLFVLAGALYVLTATFSLVPLTWNMNSVLKNCTIDFPPEFHLPPAPVRQRVGIGIVVGILASIMMLISGMLFLCYRYVWTDPEQTREPLHSPWTETTLTQNTELSEGVIQGMHNPAFLTEAIS